MAPATVRRAPYKDFLQPALHRRFSSTASFLFILSYAIAILLGSFDSFLWSWFPIGPVGFRTAFLFASALAVIVLRISQYHVGIRASASPFLSAVPNLFSIQFLEAWLFYGFSSGFFGLVYLWTASESGDLAWIKVSSGDRARLNQRPVFVAFYLAVSAAVQAFLHIARDEDRIEIDVSKRKVAADGTSPSSRMSVVLSRLPAVFVESFMKATISWTVAYSLYATIFRRPVWAWAMAFFRPFYNLPKTNIAPSEGVLKLSLMSRCTWAGFLLFIIWNIGNYAFSLFMVKAPLKNGKPLTSESKDPNGSLLNGLKSKKMPIRCFAFWELAFIARDFEIRRKAIFEDIDRKDGPMWSQVYAICHDVIRAMEKRIDDYGKPPPPPVAAQQELAPVEPRARTSAPPKDDPIFQTRSASRSMRSEVEKAIGQVARDPGQTPLSQLSPRALKTFRDARDKMLTPEQQAALDPARATGFVQSLSLWVIENEHIGWIFRQSFRRRFAAAVLGTPFSEASHHINAVDALTHLVVHSLSEDKFGNVHRDVTSIIRTFTAVIKKLEAFKAGFPTHWTDTEKSKDSPEVDAVLSALKTGLAEIVREFEPYAMDLRLSRTDLRLAREASVQEKVPEKKQPQAEGRPEMTQTR
ncbi:nuclear envelope protein [Plectosphaerella plurivora]|uniref:Nuclear envelope protein n=1 Tax=Plectosphaerella plurivora TaxID=936078 RepID=A0A9P8VKX8_9PEZI|nr:nuclear envelope protein [Plectosphaerella plurivora]